MVCQHCTALAATGRSCAECRARRRPQWVEQCQEAVQVWLGELNEAELVGDPADIAEVRSHLQAARDELAQALAS